jgi:hypothetical protein
MTTLLDLLCRLGGLIPSGARTPYPDDDPLAY